METIPCPGCRTDLDPSATVCPICMRPRGKLEITRAFATLREMEKQRKKRPFVIAGRLLAVAAIGGVLFRFQAPILKALSLSSAFISKSVNDALYPPGPAPAAAAPADGAPAPSGAGSPSAFPAAASEARAAVAHSAAAPAPAHVDAASKMPRRPAHVEDLPLPAFDPSAQWAFYGRAFDLITLKPVADAQISINILSNYRTGTDLAMSARTDADGRFLTLLRRLPEGSSYEIRVSRMGYAAPVLYEPDIPYATLPLADRQEIVRSAQDGDVALPPLTDVAGESSMRRDIFLAPAR